MPPGDIVLVHRFSGSSRKHGILRGGEFRPLFHLGENVFQNGAKGEISAPALGFDRAVFAPIPLPANSNCQRGQRLAIDCRELIGEIDAPPLQPADLGDIHARQDREQDHFPGWTFQSPQGCDRFSKLSAWASFRTISGSRTSVAGFSPLYQPSRFAWVNTALTTVRTCLTVCTL